MEIRSEYMVLQVEDTIPASHVWVLVSAIIKVRARGNGAEVTLATGETITTTYPLEEVLSVINITPRNCMYEQIERERDAADYRREFGVPDDGGVLPVSVF